MSYKKFYQPPGIFKGGHVLWFKQGNHLTLARLWGRLYPYRVHRKILLLAHFVVRWNHYKGRIVWYATKIFPGLQNFSKIAKTEFFPGVELGIELTSTCWSKVPTLSWARLICTLRPSKGWLLACWWAWTAAPGRFGPLSLWKAVEWRLKTSTGWVTLFPKLE